MPLTERPLYLRPYREGDLEPLYQLDVSSFQSEFRFSRSTMLEAVSSSQSIVRLACQRGMDGTEQILGFCAVKIEHDEAGAPFGYVSTLDVDPNSRGRGYGAMLMLAVEALAAALGSQWMALHVYVNNNSARRLYERLGYTRAKLEREFYGAGLDAWLYQKLLVGTL